EQWDELYETAGSGQLEWKKCILSCLNQQNHCVFVAVDHLGMIVGYIHGSFHLWPFSPFKVYGSLNTVAIRPVTQGQDIGKRLVRKLLDWFKLQKIQHISVHVDYRNQVALSLYEKVGFQPYQHRLMLNLRNQI
ncbi:MAG: GNAT family N-acetyltransferase, partial [Candidatus Hodarchaeota archaeon]